MAHRSRALEHLSGSKVTHDDTKKAHRHLEQATEKGVQVRSHTKGAAGEIARSTNHEKIKNPIHGKKDFEDINFDVASDSLQLALDGVDSDPEADVTDLLIVALGTLGWSVDGNQ